MMENIFLKTIYMIKLYKFDRLYLYNVIEFQLGYFKELKNKSMFEGINYEYKL